MAVVLAADSVGGAGAAAADADDGDGGAGEADEDAQVLEDDAQEAKDGGDRWVIRLRGLVAALNGAGATGRIRGQGIGGRKKWESEESKGLEGDHCERFI